MKNENRYRRAIVKDIPNARWACLIEPEAAINGVEISGTVYVGFASYMNRGQIRGYGEIGRYCSIGRDVSIGLGIHDLENTSTSPFFKFKARDPFSRFVSREPRRRTVIGNDVWIGDGVRINSGVTVGHGAVIATGATVVKDVEPFSVVGGLPAKFIKWRFPEEVRNELLRLSWWDYEPNQVRSLLDRDPEVSIQRLRAAEGTLELFPVRYLSIRGSKRRASEPNDNKTS